MQQPPTQVQKLSTNSCIQLIIPLQYHQQGPITCTWISTPAWISKYPNLFLFLTRSVCAYQRAYYVCSPLDIGNRISVKVHKCKGMENIVLQTMNYGVVQVQDGIIDVGAQEMWDSVDILFSKFAKRQGKIKISGQTSTGTLTITITTSTTTGTLIQLPITLTQSISKHHLSQFQKQPFFKLYCQPNTVGVYLSPTDPQIREKINELKIGQGQGQGGGNYLKIQFKNRACRDFFILSVLGAVETDIQSLRGFRCLSERKGERQGKQDTKQGCIKQTKIQKKSWDSKNLPKIQSTVRASQIVSPEPMNMSNEEQSDEVIQQDILEDIYNILYTPGLAIQGNNRFVTEDNSRLTVQDNTRLAIQTAKKICNIGAIMPEFQDKSIQIIDSINEDMQVFQTSDRNLQKVNSQNQLNNYQNGQLNNQTTKLIQYPHPQNIAQAYPHPRNPHRSQSPSSTHPPPSPYQTTPYPFPVPPPYPYPQYHPQCQSNLQNKINQLTMINMALASENSRLKLENQKLKVQQTRMKDINKMREIKDMVRVMAAKLGELSNSRNFDHQDGHEHEHEHELGYGTALGSGHCSGKDGFLMVPELRIQDFQRTREIGEEKRVWSPRTHQQIMKNMKIKQNEDRNWPKPPKRKNSSNHTDQSSKMGLTFGKSPFSPPIPQSQPQQLYQLPHPQLTKKPMPQTTQQKVQKKNTYLISSTRQHPGKYSNSSNSNGNTTENTFRNVFN